MHQQPHKLTSTRWRALSGAICVLSMSAGAACGAPGAPALQAYGAIKPSIAGISSGGFMAVQVSVAYSRTFTGAAVFAGGPYYCAVNNVDVAQTSCMNDSPAIAQVGINLLEANTNAWAMAGWIDATRHLAKQKIYLYSGTRDSTVVQPVVTWLKTYYQHYIAPANIVYDNASSAEHAWVTWKSATGGAWSGSGSNTVINACTFKGTPYLNHCGNDPQRDLIKHVYGAVTSHAATASGAMLPFDQTAFVPFGMASAYSVADTGYVYVPSSCARSAGCKVIVALHGCNQGYGVVGNAFITDSGLNEYADTNRILIVYPQLVASPLIPFNPRGCWDFWGYTGPNYPLKSGAQPAMLKAMVDRVMARRN